MNVDQQRSLIVEQFTKQAIPFAQLPNHNNEDTNQLVINTIGIGPQDTVLDLACGPGLITSAVAGVAKHVTGIDITPAMIEQAQHRQQSLGLTNMSFQVGDVQPVPAADATFSSVMTRYSFHHFLDPQGVLQEMVRVCQPGGQVGVIDVFMSSPEQAELYDQMEKLRDPSHVRALLLAELTGLFWDAGLKNLRTAFYKVEVELEELLKATHTQPDAAAEVRAILKQDLGHDRLGVGAVLKHGAIYFGFPVVVIAGQKPLRAD